MIKMESNTELQLSEIWGIDAENIWVMVYDVSNDFQNKLMKYDGENWSTIINEPNLGSWPPDDYTSPYGPMLSLWCTEKYLYIGGYSIYRESHNSGKGELIPMEEIKWQASYGVYYMRGNHDNDIFISSEANSEIGHYNGVDWYFYNELHDYDANGTTFIRALDVKDNCAVIAGVDWATGKALVYRGIRIE